MPLPYTIAVLCYLFDAQGKLLLLHRGKAPNYGLYSPIGGKLDQSIGESPCDCAIRETHEETGLALEHKDLHLTGIVSESSYANENHWLMFLYEGLRPVELADHHHCPEGRLEWHHPDQVPQLSIPETDRQVIWPLFQRYRGGFFSVHIDCGNAELRWKLHQPTRDVELGEIT